MLNFDGTGSGGSVVSMGSPTKLDNIFAAGGGTIMCWVKFTSYGPTGFGHMLNKASAIPPTDGWNFVAEGDLGNNYVAFGHSSSGTTGFWNSGTGSLLINTEYHVAMTYDKTSSANLPTFYINGVSSIFTDAQSTGTMSDDSAQDFLVGNSTANDATFDGDIGDVRAYDRILTSSEIQTIHRTRGRDGIVDGILGRWQFNDEPLGTTTSVQTFYVDSVQASVSSSTSLTLGVPTHSDGDLLFAMICPGGNATGIPASITAPAGWTLITLRFFPSTTSTPSLNVFRRTASSEPPSYSFPCNQTCSIVGIMGSYDGTEITQTEDTFASSAQTTLIANSPSITPNNDAIVFRVCGFDGTVTPSPTSNFFPPGTVQRNIIAQSGVGNGCYMGYSEEVAAGLTPTGIKDFTGGVSDQNATIVMSFLGGSGGGSGIVAIDSTENKNDGSLINSLTFTADNLSFRRPANG